MVANKAEPRRATSLEELQPLIELSKAGRLFDVQRWIAEAKPLDPPQGVGSRSRKKTPLEYAIESGFHSLVQVLLEGGASVAHEGMKCPMELALSKRRFDIIQLLVTHGFDPKTVSMERVFETWDPRIFDFFVDHGADVETGMPLAQALCNRVRTAIGVLKRYRERFPSFQEQANVALRHHCREGNLKWVSLLIWAGADPWAPGEAEPGREIDPDDGGLSALGFAALYDQFDVFSLEKVILPLDHPGMRQLLGYLCKGQGVDLLERLLAEGLNPNDQENGGCSTIQELLEKVGWFVGGSWFDARFGKRGADSDSARERMKVIHLLAKHGGRWRPTDRSQVNAARRSLLKMTPDYTLEFIWIMERYGACEKSAISSLIGMPSMKTHLRDQRVRLREILKSWREQGDELENR